MLYTTTSELIWQITHCIRVGCATSLHLNAWLYHRLHRKDQHWPRRLIWCLLCACWCRGLIEEQSLDDALLNEKSRTSTMTMRGTGPAMEARVCGACC